VSTTLFLGGHIENPIRPAATALLIDGAQVAWVGTDDAAEADRSSVDVVVDLAGALVAPAFVDAHVHVTSTGLTLTGLDLTMCRSATELLDQLQEYCRRARGGVVLGHGWDETTWSDSALPTRQDIDRASYGGVVYLSRIDVHSCLASSALMAMEPSLSGHAGFDDSGWLRQAAHHAARELAFESVTPAQRRTAQRTTRQHAASLGIGTIHEAGGPQINGPDDFQELLALSADEPGPNVLGYWGQAGGPAAASALGAKGAAGDLFIDGAIGSRTARLRHPYADSATLGAQYLDTGQISEHLVECSREGAQAGFHVIGDAAMDALIDGLRTACKTVGSDRVRAAHHRLEHVELVDAEQIALLSHLGVVASVQPVFDELWGGADGMYVTRLGADRAAGMNPYAAMIAAGLRLAFGSDAPVTPMGPWRAIRAAARHRTPSSRISVREGFAAHTQGGWHAAGLDDGGVLAPGASADLAIWAVPDGTTELPELHDDQPLPVCLRTVVQGHTVYTAA